LVEPGRHEPVLADEAVRRGAGGEANAELLAEIGEGEPLEVDLDVGVLFHEQLDALVHPWPLLRIVERPETDVDRLLGLGEGAPRHWRGRSGAEARRADAANHVAPRRIDHYRFTHHFLPNMPPDLSP